MKLASPLSAIGTLAQSPHCVIERDAEIDSLNAYIVRRGDYLPHTAHVIIVKSVQKNSGGTVYAGNPTDLRELRSPIVPEFPRSHDLFL